MIGCVQPWGAINPISEIQCRWVTGVFNVSSCSALSAHFTAALHTININCYIYRYVI